MRTRVSLVLVGALMTLGAGCGSSAERSTGSVTRPTPSSSESASDTSPRITVLDVGAEPRKALRLDLQKGDEQDSTLTMQMSMGIEIDGRKLPTPELPPMAMDMSLAIGDVRPDGTIVTTFDYTAARVNGTGATARELESKLQQMVGVGGTIETTDTGIAVDADINVPDKADPALKSLMDSFESQVSNLSVPLPVDAVGVGARWTAATQAELNGIRLEVLSTYHLVRLTPRGAVLDVTVVETVPEQDPTIPGMPAGARMHIDPTQMTGSGRTTVDLGLLMPVAMNSRLTGEMRMTVKADGKTQKMVQTVRNEMEIARR